MIFRLDNDAASVITSLKDNMRKGERLTVAPGGSLAAIADSLGRVLLVDVNAVVVVRLWKVIFRMYFLSLHFLPIYRYKN